MSDMATPVSGTRRVPIDRSVSGTPGRVAALVRIEGRGLDALPGGRWAILGAALLVGAVFGGLRPGIERFYAESAPFLVLAMAFGLFGRTAATALVAGYVATDAVRTLSDSNPGVNLNHLVYDRIVAWILLWVLAAALPRFARRTTGSLVGLLGRRLSLGSPGAMRVGRAVAGGGLFVAAAYAFMQLMPYLRTRDLAPGYQDVLLLQGTGLLLAAIAGVLYVVVEISMRGRVGGAGDFVDVGPVFPEWSLGGLARRVIGFAAIVFLFQGLISDQLDVVVFAAAFVAGEAGAFVVSRSPRLLATIAVVPALPRTALGLAITMVIGLVLYEAFYDPFTTPTDYFPWVVSIAVGFFAMRVLFATSSRPPAGIAAGPRSSPLQVPPVAAGLIVVATLGFLAFAVPSPVFADNCVGLEDCVAGAKAAALAALAAGLAFGWSVIDAKFNPTPEPLGVLLTALGSEETPDRLRDLVAAARAFAADRALTHGDQADANERAYGIRQMSDADFIAGAQRGDFNDLGGNP